ncbi:LamG-like jellyroll fold domain-containing protein [Streptomyces sp. NBC_01207]|uniref:LamG-like jellyroll fold domain-containing protein n=1 Tax=Streptomyces sp. NBC_01207 TaxID=2903772 RepID=UPI002E1294BB|nr:DNRLRE domain-containing protein [Streptomyces sp. NBC_01207]WSR20293.1 DNRLRE domain-containing protein [Streptomyces sp. NBC_01207]
MAVLAGTEQAALAVNQWVIAKKVPGAGERPEQAWGSARGRGHDASGDATDADAEGGRRGAQKAPGELMPAAGAAPVNLGGEPQAKIPQIKPVEAPKQAAPAGFDPKRSVEQLDKRDQRSRTFRNEDGTYTTQYYDEQVNFLSREGTWKAIDTSLARPKGAWAMSASSSGWEPRSTDDSVFFAEYADGNPLVRLGVEGKYSLGYGIEGVAHSLGQVAGSKITYADVRPSSDVELVAGADSIKETLVLKDKSAPTQWRFPLELSGLTAKLDANGNVVYLDAEGTERGWMPTGWMEDSNIGERSNEGAISAGVKYSLATEGGRQILVVTLDAQWLAAPERVYPVKVDPSVDVTGVRANSGTYVQSPYNANNSSSDLLKVGTPDGGASKAAAFLRFDNVTSSLNNAWVIAADLSLWNSWSYSCNARPVTIHEITSNWSESSTTTMPGPATGPALGSKSFAHGWRPAGATSWNCAPGWESISLGESGRQLVDDWTHGRRANYGLAVKASTSDSYSWKQFHSDSAEANGGSGKPSLNVTWTQYGAAYQLGGFVKPMTATSEGTFKVTVTNKGQQTWPAGGNIKLRYDLYDANNNLVGGDYWSKIRWTDMPHDVPPGASVTLDAAIAPLAPATYTLVWTMDDYGASSFQAAGVPGAAVRFEAVNIPPQLTGLAPASGVLSDTLTPTLWAAATDKDYYPNSTLTYMFEMCEVEGADTRKNCRQSPSSSSRSWMVPSGWLTWSKRYAWYAYANDGQAQSNQPGASILTTQVPQPVITSHLGGADSGRSFGERAGNYATAATDAAVPVIGPELAVTRTYNSQDPRQGNAFGAGWATRWDMRAKAEADGNVLITLANGSQVRFGRNNDGTYSAPSGSMGILTAIPGGGWTLRDASATLYTFDTTGLLTKTTDGHSREQLLTYTGGLLTKATDALSKRALTFTWSGGRISSVSTDAVGPGAPALTWTYTYSSGRLTKVCPPTSTTACSVYEYTGASQYRSTVLDANPVSYWRLNEAEGSAAASEAVSRTGLNAGRYRNVTLGTPGVLTGTGNKATTFNGTTSYVELPEATLSSSKILTAELWFKTTKPGVLLGFQDKRITDGKPNMWNPALVIDTSGKLRGGFELAGEWKDPMASTAVVTDGTWHHAVLTSSGTSETLYLDGQSVGSRTGTVDHSAKTFTYLGAGFSSVAWDGNADQEIRYFNGVMDDVAVYHRALDASTIRAHYDARTGTSKLTKSTLPSGRTGAQIAYDGDTERATQVTDASGGTWQISAPRYSAGSQAYATAVQGTSPVNYWRLGDTSGAAAADEISNGGNGSYHEGVTLGSVGAFLDGDDGSITLDGTKGAVEVPAETIGGATTLAVEMWFRTDKPNGVLVGLQNAELGATPTQWNPSLLIDADGKLRGELWRGTKGTSITSSQPVTDNQWHHVALTGGAAGQTMYLDGAKVGFQAGAVKPETVVQAYLGAGYSHWDWDGRAEGTRYFSGQLDEAAFYNKELDAATVADHYKARTRLVTGSGDQYQGAVMADAPTSYWQLDETTGTRVTNKITATGGNGTYTKAKLATPGTFGSGDRTAAEFTGDGYAQLPGAGIIPDTDLSVELWFKTSKPGVLLSNQTQPLPQASANWAPVLYVGADNKLHGQYLTPSTTPTNTSPGTVTDNQWHHAVLTAQGFTQTLYLDGTQVAQATNVPVDHETNKHTYIGAGYTKYWPASPGDGITYFTGQLDEVAVYPRPLTGEQIAKHYNARTLASGSSLTSTVTVTNPMGAKTTSTYDAVRGQRRTASTDAEGGVTTYAYDTGGFLHTVTDPNGHATVTGHDERGNTVSTTKCRDADSCWTSFAEYHYNAADPLDPRNGKPTAVRDARSTGAADDRYRTTTSYTSLGLTDAVTLADGRTSKTTYTTGNEPAVGGGNTPAGLVATRKSPGGATVSYSYYASGDTAQSTAASGLITKYTYDGIGRTATETQTSTAQPEGVTTAFTYNAMSRITSETGPGVKNEITDVTHTARTSRTYDDDGNLLTESIEDTTGGDPKRTNTYRYNTGGLNDSRTDAAGNEATYGHDALGRINRETDPMGNVTTYSYTPRGQVAETVLKNWTGDPSGQPRDLVTASHSYDPAGRLASTTDAMGATTAFTYFDDGLKAKVTAKDVTQADGSKHDIVLEANEYDGAGHLTQQTTGGGRTTVTSTVDATGRTTRTVIDPNGLNRVTTMAYDGDDRITESTQSIDDSGKKLTTTTEYDAGGNPKKSTVTDGTSTRTSSATFDQRGRPLTAVSPRGNTTTNRYDVLGRLVEQTAPQVQAEENGGTASAVTPKTLTGYNTFAETTETRDARGMVTRTETDKLGRPTAVTLPDYTPPGGTKITAVARTSYDQLGRPTSQTDPLGRATLFDYDQLGNLIRKTEPATAATGLQAPGAATFNGTSTALSGGGVSTYTWTPTGLPLSATDPTGARTEATHDQLGRQLTATTVERKPTLQNLVSRYTWDDASNQTSSTTPAGRKTTATHSTAGEVLTVTDPRGGITRSVYDGLGRTIETKDATARKTTTAYDVLGMPTTATDFGTGTTALRTVSSEYDADGNMTASTSATGSRRTYTYDALGRKTKQTEPISANDSITTSFGYDAAGNQTRLTDGRGKATYYTFTPWGLPESTIEPPTTQHWNPDVRTWTTTYDAAGQPVSELLPGNVKRQRTYDALGRLTNETGSGTAAATRPRTLSYDLAGRMTGSGGDGVLANNTYTYNDRGQLLTTDGPSGKSAYTYDADGSMTSRKDASGTTAFTYDIAGRLDTVTDPLTGTQIQTDFDAAGRPTLQQYARPGTGGTYTPTAKRAYNYDSLGRLSKDTVTRTAGGDVQGQAYDYDLADQLVRKTTTGTTGAADNTYTYDLAGRMTSWSDGTSTTPFEWDKAGNLTKRGNTTGTYDSRNRLETWGTETYAYSARGTEKTITETAGGATRTIQTDAFERTIINGTSTFTYDSLDRVMTHNGTAFTYDGGSNRLVADGATNYTRLPDGTVLSTGVTGQAGAARLAVTDQHTDLVASLAPDGTAVAGSRAFDPFGKTTASQGSNPNLGYQSGWTDSATGEVNMAARWYQPGIGSFTSRDTWQLDPNPSVRANRYTYANASPLNFSDPTGHDTDLMTRGNGQNLAPGPIRPPSSSYWNPVFTGIKWGFRVNPIGISLRVFWEVMAPTPAYGPAPRRDGGFGIFGGGGRCNHWLCGVGSFPIGGTRIYPQQNTRARTPGRTPGRPPGSTPPCRRYCAPPALVGPPPPPPPPQNPNEPASDLIVRINWDPKKGSWDPSKGWDTILDANSLLAQSMNGAALTPDQAPDPIQGYSAVPGSDPGAGEGDDACDTGAGWDGNKVYLPRMRHAGACVATGAYAQLTQRDYTPPPRPALKFPLAGLKDLPADDRARGHLIGFSMGGSNKDTRNFVPMYQAANQQMWTRAEDLVVDSIKGGGHQFVEVRPVYGDASSPIPTKIKFTSFGTKDVRCEFDNTASATYKCW